MIDALRRRWEVLAPGHGELGAELLARWGEPHRSYHGPLHLAETLAALDRLGPAGAAESFALWFHDAVHTGAPGSDERASAELAGHRLAAHGFDHHFTAEVVRLVLVTIEHRPAPGDLPGARVSDADLAVLAAHPDRYRPSVAELRAESPGLDETAWLRARRQRVHELLSSDPLFHSPAGQTLWLEPALANLTAELAQLRAR